LEEDLKQQSKMKGNKQKSASSLQDSRERLPEVRQPRSATLPLESGEDLTANPRRSERLSARNQQQQQQQHYNTANNVSQQDPSYPSQETGGHDMSEEAGAPGGALPHPSRPSSIWKPPGELVSAQPLQAKGQEITVLQVPVKDQPLRARGPTEEAGMQPPQPLRAGAQAGTPTLQSIPFDVPPTDSTSDPPRGPTFPTVTSTAVGTSPTFHGIKTFPLENQPRGSDPKYATTVHTQTVETGTQTAPTGFSANSRASSKQENPPQENLLVNEIDTEIGDMAAEVQDEVGKGNELIATMLHRPFDPNLVCPMCGKEHRIGEIQKFRVHVDNCEGD
jgi:hypothetical protein